jgi:hypothetical protein
MSNREKHNWKEKVLDELKKMLVTTIYLWLLFSLLVLHRTVILAQYHISYSWKLGFALVNALILAKFMLIAEAFHAGERFKTKPLAYSVVFKSAVFSIILMVCHVLEELLMGVWHGKSVAESLPGANGTPLNELLTLGLIMFVVLVPFFATRELKLVLGEGALVSLFFGPRPKTATLPSKA